MSMMKYKLQKLIKFRHPKLLTVVTAGMLWLWEIKKEERAFEANSSHINRCDFAMNYEKQGDNFERIILYRLFIILNRMSQFLISEKADYRIAKKVGFDLLSFPFKRLCSLHNTVCILQLHIYCRENASAFLSPAFVFTLRLFHWFCQLECLKIENI